jgi:hypothetical protein
MMSLVLARILQHLQAMARAASGIITVRCTTPGQNPSQFNCLIGQPCIPGDITHQQAGRSISGCHRAEAQGGSDCVVVTPKDQR